MCSLAFGLMTASHGKKVEHAVFAFGIGKNLRVYESLIEHGIDARDVLANDGFQPALGWTQ